MKAKLKNNCFEALEFDGTVSGVVDIINITQGKISLKLHPLPGEYKYDYQD